jgi:hypothetical protein
MTSKLTLSLDAKVIARAKKYSQKKGVSLSRIVEQHLNSLTEDKNSQQSKTSLMRLKGILGPAEDFDYDKAKYEYLKEKYNL